MPWPLMAASVASGLLKSFGARKAAKRHNAMMARLLDPNNVMANARIVNPWIAQALRQGGFQKALNQIAADPGYIDPRLMNLSLGEVDLGAANAQRRYMTQLGRGSMGVGGGMAKLMPLVMSGRRNMQRAAIKQNYALDRANRMRQDLDWLLGTQNKAFENAANLVGARASSYQVPLPWETIGGNAIQSGIAMWPYMKKKNVFNSNPGEPYPGTEGSANW